MTRTTTPAAGFKRLPRTYAGLVAMLPPRPIHDKVDYDNAVEMIDRLAGFDLTADQEDYLDALATFVEAYERDASRRWMRALRRWRP
jgi:HTH-type transcriptional regulator/antitoxin HigA